MLPSSGGCRDDSVTIVLLPAVETRLFIHIESLLKASVPRGKLLSNAVALKPFPLRKAMKFMKSIKIFFFFND